MAATAGSASPAAPGAPGQRRHRWRRERRDHHRWRRQRHRHHHRCRRPRRRRRRRRHQQRRHLHLLTSSGSKRQRHITGTTGDVPLFSTIPENPYPGDRHRHRTVHSGQTRRPAHGGPSSDAAELESRGVAGSGVPAPARAGQETGSFIISPSAVSNAASSARPGAGLEAAVGKWSVVGGHLRVREPWRGVSDPLSHR